MMTEAATRVICIQYVQFFPAILSILSFFSLFYSVLLIKYQDSILL